MLKLSIPTKNAGDNMRKYENQVQLIKSNVLTEVARFSFLGTLEENAARIPYIVNPGPDERYRCCIYHERAISADRVKMAMGGTKSAPGIIEILESACDQCPVNRLKGNVLIFSFHDILE